MLEDPLDVLRLINRDHLLDRDYPDQEIEMYRMVSVTAPLMKNPLTIRPVVNDALTQMLKDAQDQGHKLYVVCAYRSYRTQEVQHYNRVKSIGKDDGLVQPAGASEHQAGLAADVASRAYQDRLLQSFGDTEEGRWLESHCARCGFILRYPPGQMEVTGVDYEPWHLRYVGVEAATYIMTFGLTLEAFTEEWPAVLEAYQAAQ